MKGYIIQSDRTTGPTDRACEIGVLVQSARPAQSFGPSEGQALQTGVLEPQHVLLRVGDCERRTARALDGFELPGDVLNLARTDGVFIAAESCHRERNDNQKQSLHRPPRLICPVANAQGNP